MPVEKGPKNFASLGEVLRRSLERPTADIANPTIVSQLKRELDNALNVGCTRQSAFEMLGRFYDAATLTEVFPELMARTRVVTAVANTIEPSPTPNAASRLVHTFVPPEELAFQYVPLIQCSFPHSDVAPANTYSRRNGRLELTIATSRVELGLPYGTPARLLTMFVATEVKRTKEREICLGPSLQDFLNRIGVPISRGERGSIAMYANQLQRLYATQFSINETLEDGAGRQGLRFRQRLLFVGGQLWWDEGFTGENSTLLVDEAVFESMLERCAPLKTSSIRALRKSPMDLDVYAWLVHRLYVLHRPSRVTWEQLSSQFGHSYTELRVFKHWFLKSLKRVHVEYPQANFTVEAEGLFLKPSPPHVARVDKFKALDSA